MLGLCRVNSHVISFRDRVCKISVVYIDIQCGTIRFKHASLPCLLEDELRLLAAVEDLEELRLEDIFVKNSWRGLLIFLCSVKSNTSEQRLRSGFSQW